MKRALVISLVVFSLSCSKEFQEEIIELKVSPPVWLDGTWSNKDNASENIGWKFTSDKVVRIDSAGSEVDILFSTLIIKGLTGEEITIKEYFGTNSYSILIDGETFSDTYDFSRVSSQEMSWDNAPPLNTPEFYVRNN